jgi:uncharacterized LabA/DUF88 family protein
MTSAGDFIFIDGSSLIAEVRYLQNQKPVFKGRKLDLLKLMEAFWSAGTFDDLMDTERYIRRCVFYFANGDGQIDDYLVSPKSSRPGLKRDLEIRRCGVKLPRSAKYDEWLKNVPDEFLDRCHKSEKGVDIEICCDALQLAALGQLRRLFLFTNDSDFIPLCRKIKEFGANISLVRLSEARPVNSDLAEACDSYDIFEEACLNAAFFPLPT